MIVMYALVLTLYGKTASGLLFDTNADCSRAGQLTRILLLETTTIPEEEIIFKCERKEVTK